MNRRAFLLGSTALVATTTIPAAPPPFSAPPVMAAFNPGRASPFTILRLVSGPVGGGMTDSSHWLIQRLLAEGKTPVLRTQHIDAEPGPGREITDVWFEELSDIAPSWLPHRQHRVADLMRKIVQQLPKTKGGP